VLSAIEQTRLRISKNTDAKWKSRLGQFFTPVSTAQFMAGLFPEISGGACRLLDAGAGIGSLSGAFLEKCISSKLAFGKIDISAFEFDERLHGELKNTLATYLKRTPLSYEVICGDFIEEAINRIQFGNGGGFTHAILNPPYKKISSDSRHRLLLRQVGIETVNLYSAFVALTLLLMAPGGYIVAIIPRSFCNGPYYRPFRNMLLDLSAIRHIHLFESRNTAFKDDGVLQENVIIMLERGGKRGDVHVTTSVDDRFSDFAAHVHTFERIVLPGDRENFIHIPTTLDLNTLQLSAATRHTLDDLGIKVSTGPVVDFRLKEHLRSMPESGAVPLLYPGHFDKQGIVWPIEGMKKPNAIQRNPETEKWLYPNGYYCVVRRFSSKEEKHRIIASVVRPDTFAGSEVLGFENHLNVFHENKYGLPENLAYGLAAFLNTTAVDENFRSFNGHTQVNATDLKLMKYPSRGNLMALGEKAKLISNNQQALDDLFLRLGQK